MFELLGYIILILSVGTSMAIIVEIQNYLAAFICFWIGLTIGSMFIMHAKQD